MPNLTCSYCLRTDLDPQEEFCPACGAPLEPPIQSSTLPEPIPSPIIKPLPEFVAPELSTGLPQELPTEQKKPSVLLWIGIAAGGLCLLAVLCAVIFSLIAFPQRRQQSGPQSPAVVVVRPTVTARQQVLIPSPTPRPAGKLFVGELAPEFTLLEAISGEEVILSAFTRQPVLLHFWATWCT